MDPAWLTALVALAVAVAGFLVWAARHGWHILRRITHFLDDYAGQPARDGMPARPGFMARLTSVETLLSRVDAETSPNHGTSLRDVVHQTARDVGEIKSEQARLRVEMGVLRARRESER